MKKRREVLIAELIILGVNHSNGIPLYKLTYRELLYLLAIQKAVWS